MDQASFKIRFIGPAVEGHAIDVNDLAPALLAIGDLIKAANTELYGKKSGVAVKIEAFEAGSFGIDFQVLHEVAQDIGTLIDMAGPRAQNLVAVLGLAGLTCKGLLSLLHWSKGRPVAKISDDPIDTKQVIFVTDDGDSLVVPRDTVVLYCSSVVRKKIEEAFVKPLSNNEGIESIVVSADDSKKADDAFTITQAEKSFYAVPSVTETELISNETELWVQPISVTFKENNKWRFSTGKDGMTFYATMLDKDFMTRVMEGLAISVEDKFRIKLRTEQKEAGNTLATLYYVVEVIEHRPAGTQLILPLDK